MHDTINIGPVSNNQEAQLKLTIGRSVSEERILAFVKTSTEVKEKQRLITANEADAMLREAEDKLKRN
jgi:hypothetical protein